MVNRGTQLGRMGFGPPLAVAVRWTGLPSPVVTACFLRHAGRSVSALPEGTATGRAVATMALLLCLGSLQAQIECRRLPSPQIRSGHACAVDPVSGELVLHGGLLPTFNRIQAYPVDTWFHVAGRWQPALRAMQTANPPIGERQHLLVDSIRGRLLLVGGHYLIATFPHTLQRSIWQFQGGTWTQLSAGSSTSPASQWTNYAYDDLRDRIVAYDPSTSGATWEWSTGGWTLMAPVQSPPHRYAATLVFDRARRRTLLFGGGINNILFNDTWEWDGSNWQQMTPALSPAPRAFADAVHDPVRGRTLLTGGEAQARFGDVWAYDASGWTQLSATGAPSRPSAAVAYDPARQRLIVMGGLDEGLPCSDLWEWDGVQWQQVEPTTVPPDATLLTDLAQNKVIAHSGSGRVWERYRDGWTQVAFTGSLPPARSTASFAYDPIRRRTVMFGGMQGQQLLNDTWEWNGSAWSQSQPFLSPSPRQSAGMASDPTGGVLLFGGSTQAGLSNETWRWDGAAWTQLLPNTPPPARSAPPLACDPLRGVVVMFGDGAGQRYDTWEWNGSQWLQRTPASRPYRGVHLAFDQARGVVTLLVHIPLDLHQFPPVSEETQVWDWNGIDWTFRLRSLPSSSLPVIYPSAFGYDPAALRCVANDSEYYSGGSFEIGAVQSLATVANLGPGCSPSRQMYSAPLYLGEYSQVWFDCGAAPGPAFLVLGLSSASWAGTPLPLALGALGAPGCNLLVAPDAIVFLGPVVYGTSPILYLTVPANPQYAGLDLHLQGLVFAPQANAAGLSLSAASTLRLGLR